MKKTTGTYRTVFISDLHLGSKHCNADALLNFLDTLETDSLYLVGDIVDGWRLSKKWYWPKKHNKVIQKVIKMAKNTDITYITGNHDEFLRSVKNINIGSIPIKNRVTFDALNGKRYLVVHGDMFDHVMRTRSGRFIMHFGDIAYDGLILINQMVNSIRKLFKRPPWSLAKFLKSKAKTAANYIGDFEHEMAEYCKRQKYDGIICGHIHHASIREIDGIEYMNDGDWCESCTALVEHHDGTWEIIHAQLPN